MALHIPPELEQRVTELARRTHREPEAVLTQLLGEALADDAAFREEVREGIAELDRGEGIPHEQAMATLRSAIERKSGPRTQ